MSDLLEATQRATACDRKAERHLVGSSLWAQEVAHRFQSSRSDGAPSIAGTALRAAASAMKRLRR